MDSSYLELPVLHASPESPAPFHWDSWYNSVGGRSINIRRVNEIMERIQSVQYPMFDGPVASSKKSFASGQDSNAWLHEIARKHGADIVGVAVVEPADIYAGRSVNETHALVLGAKMDYEQFLTVPSEAAAIECMRVYETLGDVVIAVANEIRGAGYRATVEHPLGDSRVMHIPLALRAGFGELGRHGSIIHPNYGPLFRIGSVLTNLEAQPDSPIDVGIGAFCDRCQACRIFCPADAIPDKRSPDHGKDALGMDRYVVDTGKCFPYFATNNYCSSCLAVCAYKHKEWAKTRDGEVGPFPSVPFGTVPRAVDPVDTHDYPKLRRSDPSPYHR